MNNQDHYSFDEGNARFAVLDSELPGCPSSEWLDASTRTRATNGASPTSTIHSIRPASTRLRAVSHPRRSRRSAQKSRQHRLQRARTSLRTDRTATGHPLFRVRRGGRNLYSVHRSPFDEVAGCPNIISWWRRSPAIDCSSKRSPPRKSCSIAAAVAAPAAFEARQGRGDVARRVPEHASTNDDQAAGLIAPAVG